MRVSLRFLLRTIVIILALVLLLRVLQLFAVNTRGRRPRMPNFPYMYDDDDQMGFQLRYLQNQQGDNLPPGERRIEASALLRIAELSQGKVNLSLSAVDEQMTQRLRRMLFTSEDVAQRRYAVNTLNSLQFTYNLQTLMRARNESERPSNLPENVLENSTLSNFRSLNRSGEQISMEQRSSSESYSINFVILVQTHDRNDYLRELIASLSKVVGIERTLLIISHDFYSEGLDDTIGSIDFRPLVQLFYPFAHAWYEKQYPADDPRDCARDVPRELARKDGCNNAEWPDSYGHYREWKFTQTKHHYAWKLAYTFDQLRVLNNYSGPVILLEDDHFVSEDLLHFATLTNAFRKEDMKRRQGSSIVSLGHYERVNYRETNLIIRTLFESTKNNMGMMVDRQVWNELKACSKAFCEYDDYNWDWSLQFLSIGGCIKGNLAVYAARVPRVFHIGNCGVHHRQKGGKVCNAAADAQTVRELLKPLRGALHSVASLQLAGEFRPLSYTRMNNKSNGGWGDRRDHELCKANIVGHHTYLDSVVNVNNTAVNIARDLVVSAMRNIL